MQSCFLSLAQNQTHMEIPFNGCSCESYPLFCQTRYGVPKCHIDKLQRVQNAAARLIVIQGKFCLIAPVLHQLHRLPVSFYTNFKNLLLTFKAIHELAPSYINDLVKIKPLNSRYRLRSKDGILLSHRNLKLKQPWATVFRCIALFRRLLNSGTIYFLKLEWPNLLTL